MSLGTLIAIALSMIAIFGTTRWREIGPQDQRKILAQEIAGTLKGQLVWACENGIRFGAVQRVMCWFRLKSASAPEQHQNIV
jgi:hypothetical protein